MDSQMHGYFKLIGGAWISVHPSTIKAGDIFHTYDRGRKSPDVRALANATLEKRNTPEPVWGVTPVEILP